MSKKLYNLIKSLTPNERGYFKKYSKMHIVGTENLYMTLFDAVYEMPEYDKSQLPAVFRRKRMENQLPAYSNYLFTNILDALKIYHARKTIDAEIRHLLLDVELLFVKGLLPEARKILSKAKDKASQNDNFFLLIEIINWEEKIAKNDVYPQFLEKIINESHAKRVALTEEIKISLQYKWLHSRVIHLMRKTGQHIEGKEDMNKLEEIIENPLLQDENLADSFHNKSNFFYIHAIYNYIKLKPDLKKSIEYTQKRKVLMESSIHDNEMDLNAYLSTFNNLMSSYMQTLDLNAYDQLIEDLKKMPERFGKSINEKHENMRNAYVQSAILIRCFFTGEFERGVKFVKGQESVLESIQGKLGSMEVLAFYDHMRSLYFAVQDYKKALFWNNKILNKDSDVLKTDIYAIAVIWNIIIHYEMGNKGLVESLVKSAKNIFENLNRSHQFEKLFFKNIQNILSAERSDVIRNGFRIFRNELVVLKRRRREIMELDFISYMAWLDSHIEKKSYAEAFKSYLPKR